MAASSHVRALDGVRGIAIALVVLHHCQWPTPIAPPGWIGVDLFFVLSGYLITGILADTRDAPNRAQSFYARRALRIFPLYYGVLILVFVVVPLIHPVHWQPLDSLAGEEGWYWAYLSDWRVAFNHPPKMTILLHFWSLSIEEQFYWVWPIVIWSLSRRTAMRLCVALLVGATLLRIYVVAHVSLGLSPATFPVSFAYYFLPTRIDGLVTGALIALALRGSEGAPAVIRWARPITVVATGALVATVLIRRTVHHDDPWIILVGYPALALAFGGLVVYAVTSPARALEWAPLTVLGKYSYGMYVLHFPILMVARGFHLLGEATGNVRLFTLIILPVNFAAAYMSYHLYEKHFLKLKDRFVAQREGLPSRIVERDLGPDVAA